ncbi:hypothetical protein [Paenirhodobacter populi]|uniref:hypothetical protein n=1 Tax=Paenirhodobacter populi TaxID=2306993 RepID=UPI001F4F62BD|nr:hypothetical protein [Sinirhodobacter populi]
MQQKLSLDLPDLEWVSLLKTQRAKGKSVSEIARECDMARPSVSMLINGTYPANSLDLATRKHGARVLRLYRDQMMCPHLQRGISAEDCRAFASAPMSTSDPDRLDQWIACKNCPLNPLKQAEEN